MAEKMLLQKAARGGGGVPPTTVGTGNTYEEIMGLTSVQSEGYDAAAGVAALSARLKLFREWLVNDANVIVHPAVCVVNGEATDGTKNAPVLAFGPPPSSVASSAGQQNGGAAGAKRCGMIDTELDQSLYDRTMGCQVRAAKELKKDEIMMTFPRSAMVTPDLIASSDAGRAVLACCELIAPKGKHIAGFWDAFENTVVLEKMFCGKIKSNGGTQLLVKILQERKKAEMAIHKKEQSLQNGGGAHKLAPQGTISTRAPILAFLIHQRFSNSIRPKVISDSKEAIAEVGHDNNTILKSVERNGLSITHRIITNDDTPCTFAPYARTLPSAIPLPFCWKRNELALLAGCIPGLTPLQDVASTTLQLASEFIALVDAGILHRFPTIFPPGLITWERWVWAASAFASRVLPVSCYLNIGEKSAQMHSPGDGETFQSPADIWNELGVMIPLLDMLNHEDVDTAQVTWEPCVPLKDSNVDIKNGSNNDDPSESQVENTEHPPQCILHKKVKKGSQVFTNYGNWNNQHLMLQYGFAQMSNSIDEVRIGWGIMECVGNTPAPEDYIPTFAEEGSKLGVHVYESSDQACINSWWTEKRIDMLEKETSSSNCTIASLKQGKKLTAWAKSDGTCHPIFLSAVVVGTMPSNGVEKKLEKLLGNLNNGLKAHFNNVELWTKTSEGGLQYNSVEGGDSDDVHYTGWQSFFDMHAYNGTMEVEKKYYALAPDSCVLTLYDGHVRSLQAALDGLSTLEKFKSTVLKQLEDLSFIMLNEDVEEKDVVSSNGNTGNKVNESSEKSRLVAKGGGLKQTNSEEKFGVKGNGGGEKSNRRRNRKKGDRPPAIKLHIGNLAYSTKPDDLAGFFSKMYGTENVLECHIPTERDTGRSRGFGFVTMPEQVAAKTLQAGRKHEVDGRLLKVAESNSAGSGKGKGGSGGGGGGTGGGVGGGGGNSAPTVAPMDRCLCCGYRPKYCTCPSPKVSGYNDGNRSAMGGPPPEVLHPPQMDPLDYGGAHGGRGLHENDHYGGTNGRYRSDRVRRSYSRSSSPRGHERSRSNREGGYGRDLDRNYRDYRYRRSRSRSYSRERRVRDRERSRRDRGSGRERERSRESRSSGRRIGRGSSRGWEGRASRSRSYSPQSRRERKVVDTGIAERQVGQRKRSPNRSISPLPRSHTSLPSSERKRDRRSRSRDRGRSNRKKKRKHAKSSPSGSQSISRSHSLPKA